MSWFSPSSAATLKRFIMKTLTKQRQVALATLAVFGASIVGPLAVQPAHADSKTWKKVAIGGAAVAGYGLLTHKGKVATIGGLVAAGSYLKYRSDKKKEARRREAWRRAYWRRHHSRRYARVYR
jgi:hypothetical protein